MTISKELISQTLIRKLFCYFINGVGWGFNYRESRQLGFYWFLGHFGPFTGIEDLLSGIVAGLFTTHQPVHCTTYYSNHS